MTRKTSPSIPPEYFKELRKFIHDSMDDNFDLVVNIFGVDITDKSARKLGKK